MKYIFRLYWLILVVFFLAGFSKENLWANEKNILLYLPFDGNCNSPISADKGKVKGNLLFDIGKVGQALSIGGKENVSVDFLGEQYLNPKQGTIAFWIKPVDWDSSKEPDDSGTSAFHFFYLRNQAYLYRRWKDTISFYCNFPEANIYHVYTAALPLQQGQWTHLGLSWLDNILKIYANGNLTGALMMRAPMKRQWHGQGIQLGESWSKNHSLIDEFYVFDYPLAASEIKQIYETSLKGQPSRLPDFKPYKIYVTHYPAVNKAYICLDINHASGVNAKAPVTADLSLINSQGPSLPLGTINNFDAINRTAEKLFELPKNLSAGNYSITARIFDANGREVAIVKSEPFEKRVYPWEHVNTGLSDEVIPPFTPLKMNANIISCWGRQYWFKKDGFPEKLFTRKTQILSDAITLEGLINDSNLKLGDKIEIINQKPGVIALRSELHNDDAHIMVSCNIEYDGAMLYNIKILPKKEIHLNKLVLNIPIKKENAKLYHICRDLARHNNESGYLSKGYDKIWGSSAKKSRDIIGSFVPYFWIGDYDRGFCWMADSDKNWSVPDNEDCVEFFRDEQALTAKVNFIKFKKTISTPWEINFTLMAGPPRPEPEGWRLGPLSKKWSSWFCGHAETLQGYGKPPNWAKYLEDVERFKKSWGYWGVNISPNDFWGVTEENKYFQLEWGGSNIGSYPLIHRNNFVMYTLDRLMSKGYIDGLYGDDAFPVISTKLVTGVGYIRGDGNVQGEYSMLALRDFFKRSAYLFRKHKCNRSLMVHMTDSMIMPCYSFWDIKNDNEWVKEKPGVTDHIDAWSLGEICARSMSRQYGMAAVWHSPADWKNSPENGGDDLGCLLLLHDILGRTANLEKRTTPGKLQFGIGEPDVEFLGYWVLQPNSDPEKKDVKMSAWVRKKLGTALLVVANLSNKDWEGNIALPLKVMGLSANDEAHDAEDKNNPRLNFNEGRLRLSIPRHNYRLLLIGPKGQFPKTASPSEIKAEKPVVNPGSPSRVKIGPPTFLKKIGGREQK
ncbi:MAG: glycoside hydrolase domain-containing protein [Thermodesulfobacteriota bacterium]